MIPSPLSVQKFSLRFPFEKCQRNTFPSGGLAVIYQNIYSLHTPAKGILSTPRVQPPPPSSYCWRYSRWPCHSRPCVPSGIRSCPQQAVPRSLQLLAIYLHTNPHSLTKHWTTHFYITALHHIKNTHPRMNLTRLSYVGL